eukprot:SAG25_NODE_6176_length_581_cov_1.717842_1_plen_159_part_10
MHACTRARNSCCRRRAPPATSWARGRTQIAPLPKPAHTRPCVATMAVRAQVKNFVEGGQRAGDPKKQISSTILFESRDFEEYTFHGRQTDLIFATKVCTDSVCARVCVCVRARVIHCYVLLLLLLPPPLPPPPPSLPAPPHVIAALLSRCCGGAVGGTL